MAQKVQAKIVSIRCLNETIWQYILEPTHFVPYEAGQYLQIHQADGVHFYSIANAPSAEKGYELHVRQRASSHLGSLGEELCLFLPYGSCDLSHLHPDKPILFLAFGTGFAPIRAMIQQLLVQKDTRQVDLHWGIAVAEDEYDRLSLQHWQRNKSNYRYHAHISPTNQVTLMPVILQQYTDLKVWQIVMAGPFELMFAIQKILLQQGLQPESIFSDAFEFADQ